MNTSTVYLIGEQWRHFPANFHATDFRSVAHDQTIILWGVFKKKNSYRLCLNFDYIYRACRPAAEGTVTDTCLSGLVTHPLPSHACLKLKLQLQKSHQSVFPQINVFSNWSRRRWGGRCGVCISKSRVLFMHLKKNKVRREHNQLLGLFLLTLTYWLDFLCNNISILIIMQNFLLTSFTNISYLIH